MLVKANSGCQSWNEIQALNLGATARENKISISRSLTDLLQKTNTNDDLEFTVNDKGIIFKDGV